MSVMCLEGVWGCLEGVWMEGAFRVSQGCLEGVWRGLKESESVKCHGVSKYSMSVGYLDSAMRVSGGCLDGVWKVSGGCPEGVWKVSGGCPEGVWRVFGRCLDKQNFRIKIFEIESFE